MNAQIGNAIPGARVNPLQPHLAGVPKDGIAIGVL